MPQISATQSVAQQKVSRRLDESEYGAELPAGTTRVAVGLRLTCH
jgi:hypothetical protein